MRELLRLQGGVDGVMVTSTMRLVKCKAMGRLCRRAANNTQAESTESETAGSRGFRRENYE